MTVRIARSFHEATLHLGRCGYRHIGNMLFSDGVRVVRLWSRCRSGDYFATFVRHL